MMEKAFFDRCLTPLRTPGHQNFNLTPSSGKKMMKNCLTKSIFLLSHLLGSRLIKNGQKFRIWIKYCHFSEITGYKSLAQRICFELVSFQCALMKTGLFKYESWDFASTAKTRLCWIHETPWAYCINYISKWLKLR